MKKQRKKKERKKKILSSQVRKEERMVEGTGKKGRKGKGHIVLSREHI